MSGGYDRAAVSEIVDVTARFWRASRDRDLDTLRALMPTEKLGATAVRRALKEYESLDRTVDAVEILEREDVTLTRVHEVFTWQEDGSLAYEWDLYSLFRFADGEIASWWIYLGSQREEAFGAAGLA